MVGHRLIGASRAPRLNAFPAGPYRTRVAVMLVTRDPRARSVTALRWTRRGPPVGELMKAAAVSVPASARAPARGARACRRAGPRQAHVRPPGRRAAQRGAARRHGRADRRQPTHAQLFDAAMVAIRSPDFYNVSLVNFVTPWTNVERTVFADLNDYTATVIGMIRDDVPFDHVLTRRSGLRRRAGPRADRPIRRRQPALPRAPGAGLDLSNPRSSSACRSRRCRAPRSAHDAAGVVTTRAAAEAFFSAGTNRRMWRFTAMNYLCRDMEALKDTSRPTDRIRQDVNRSPGGDSEIFHTQCVGCHSGMDALAGAYAYFEWDAAQSRMVHTPGQVQGKYAINTGVFPGGHITTDDSWINSGAAARTPRSAGARPSPAAGFGAKSLGAEVAHSRAFAECQVQKVFEHVCFRPPQDDADAAAIERSRPSSSATALRHAPGLRRRRDLLHGGRVAMRAIAFASERSQRGRWSRARRALGARLRRLRRQLEQRHGRRQPATASSTSRRRPAGRRLRDHGLSARCASTARRVTRATAPARRTSHSRSSPRPIRRSPARTR